ncbi:transposable element Tc3 transposase [Trichonephila clavipes]|nr:transposable element Tc3 transposase [Trichonephila clavipes]
MEYHSELVEALGNNALPYRTVARCIEEKRPVSPQSFSNHPMKSMEYLTKTKLADMHGEKKNSILRGPTERCTEASRLCIKLHHIMYEYGSLRREMHRKSRPRMTRTPSMERNVSDIVRRNPNSSVGAVPAAEAVSSDFSKAVLSCSVFYSFHLVKGIPEITFEQRKSIERTASYSRTDDWRGVEFLSICDSGTKREKKVSRRRFVEWAQNEIAVVPDFHKPILFSDEAHFWLNGYVNKHNCRIWSEANPQVYVETPLHPEKLTVWCALWAGGIIGPYFFKNDEGHNVTVNGDRYRAMITNFFIPELNNQDVQELWFQQDGSTCHTARATIDLLKDTFGDRLISRFGPVNWPPRSCDLTPLDYFLWDYVNSLVYADKPQTLDHLEDNIRRVIADIRPQMLEKSHRKLDVQIGLHPSQP